MTVETSILKQPRANFDSPWKHVLDFYFRSFMEYCLPRIAAAINWERKYELLDKELLAITRDDEVGDCVADKLIKVWKKDGKETWILCHIEIQNDWKKNFPERMLVYRYRSRDRFKKPVISIALLIDSNLKWRPTSYIEECFGSSLEIHYLVVKLLDYKEKRQELEAMNNPFATLMLAQLAVMETMRNPRARLLKKTALTRQLYEKGWNKNDIIQLYLLLDWLMILPKELMIEYHEQVKQLEGEKQMNYICTAQQIGREEGFQLGRQQGIEQGIEQGVERGIHQGETALLIRLLKCRFDMIPAQYVQRIERADSNTLLLWGERVLDAATLEEVFSN